MKNYSFGTVLKKLRHGKGITQGRLAELLGISPQSVSKWENDIGMPDVTLLCPIAGIFGVTVDYLLGREENTKSAEIEAARERTNELWRDGSDTSDECIAIWRELLKKYPTDNECRNALASELYASDRLEDNKEACSIYEAVLDESTDSKLRSDALYSLVHLYGNRLGETELAIKLAKTASDPWCSKPSLLSIIDGNPDKNHWKQYEVWTCSHSLAWAIADQDYDTVEDTIFAIRSALSILSTVFYNKPYGRIDGFISEYLRRRLCELRAKNGLFDDTIYTDIEEMIASCRRADSEQLGKYYFGENMFLNTVWYENTITTKHLKSAKELIDDAIFDPIREDERFKALYETI